MKKAKRLSAILLAIIIMLTTALSAPVSAFAKTGYWVDMNVAKVNIENLKDYIYYYGDIDTDGNEYIGYTYYGSTTENNYYITYMNNSDVLKFEGFLGDNGYVSLYYNYYDLNTSVQIAFPDAGLKARVTFDCTEYYYQDLIFDIVDSYGNLTYSEIQEFSNLYLQASVEGWDNCLIDNTPYRLRNIGFNSLCDHQLSTSYNAATFSKDGKKVSYCYECGYHEDTDYAAIGKITLSKTKYVYDGKVKKPSVSVKDNNGKKISASNYTVKYQSGRKNVGKYSVKITFVNGKYKGSKTLYFTIVPKSTTISKVTASKKAFTVKWKKQSTQTTGYQIQYSTSSKFKGAKTVTITKNKTTSKKISKLKAKKKYYVRVRTYKTVKVNGKNTKIYSGWSKVKTVKTK